MSRMSIFQPKLERLESCSSDIVVTLPEDQCKQLEAAMAKVAGRWQKLQEETNRRHDILEEAADTKASFERTLGELNGTVQQLEATCASPVPWQDQKLMQKDVDNKEVS